MNPWTEEAGGRRCRNLSSWTGAVLLLLLPPWPYSLQGAESFPTRKLELERGECILQRSGQSLTPAADTSRAWPRSKRYTVNPLEYKWDHFNLTYRIVQYPSTLNKGDTERALSLAFRMWSSISPFSFRHVGPQEESDIKIEQCRFCLVNLILLEFQPSLDLPVSLFPFLFSRI
ncbi:matrix metalloproteinase-23-like [Rhinatrema bivittatum]|uniref:matrix metalloproteinase-23-like n=1 Tax=Rhinatrema bivittatum TaxID=194408 RepID=UPI001125E6F0|nr:matrix metalloproteinase-23-like [Rhinatrema bivittatum]